MKVDCESEKKMIKKLHRDKSKKIRKKLELTSYNIRLKIKKIRYFK